MTRADALDRVIETIVVDCYNEDEAYTAFLTVIEDEVALPTPASLLGTPAAHRWALMQVRGYGG